MVSAKSLLLIVGTALASSDPTLPHITSSVVASTSTMTDSGTLTSSVPSGNNDTETKGRVPQNSTVTSISNSTSISKASAPTLNAGFAVLCGAGGAAAAAVAAAVGYI
ncbi:hypothetical protein P280DRAFT_477953 [Massarina eburnea CBS 473.64]|uniref:Uncharacterized protein n=1 Tax=Massarina eburnea CBS 473.64 TaxID=1395130 RepID=A0A6A6S5V1_9PLEO|nr:hypothetical protein P280DRAFT_477953 [Massarina eburnea CBS 473.64]